MNVSRNVLISLCLLISSSAFAFESKLGDSLEVYAIAGGYLNNTYFVWTTDTCDQILIKLQASLNLQMLERNPDVFYDFYSTSCDKNPDPQYYTVVNYQGIVYANNPSGNATVDQWVKSFGSGVPFYDKVILPEKPVAEMLYMSFSLGTNADDLGNEVETYIGGTDSQGHDFMTQLNSLWEEASNESQVLSILNKIFDPAEVHSYVDNYLTKATKISVGYFPAFMLRDERMVVSMEGETSDYDCPAVGKCLKP